MPLALKKYITPTVYNAAGIEKQSMKELFAIRDNCDRYRELSLSKSRATIDDRGDHYLWLSLSKARAAIDDKGRHYR